MEARTLSEGAERDALNDGDTPTNWYDSPGDHADFRREIAKLEALCETAREEGIVYSRIAYALAQDCVDLFYVNIETGEYVEYLTDDEHGSLTERRRAADFFESCKREAEQFVHQEDRVAFTAAMEKSFLMEALSRSKSFEMSYRRLRDGRPLYVNMKVSRMEDDGRFVVIAVTDIDELVRRRRAEERMQEERLEQVRSQANIDALTGVKNKHAFLEAEARMDRQILERIVSPFAIVVLDVNDLKKVNDTAGHHAGDVLLQSACKVICDTFKHSPVFRVGGDEFVVIAQGEDYARLEERLVEMREYNAQALQLGGAVVACGTAWFRDDMCVAEVFDRADRNMYENKNRLKRMAANPSHK